MSMPTCEKCGGFIPLGPDATNCCEQCGAPVFRTIPPMNTQRIQEIQAQTAHPHSLSVASALLQVWNEVAQEKELEKEAALREAARKVTFWLTNRWTVGAYKQASPFDIKVAVEDGVFHTVLSSEK